MLVGRLNLLAATTVLILGTGASAVCGGSSDGFQDEMGPLLFEQARLAVEFDRVLDPLFQEMSASGDPQSAARSFSEHREEFLSVHRDFVRIAEGWEALDPPSEAEAFYRRTLEMMNLRVGSLEALVAAV